MFDKILARIKAWIDRKERKPEPIPRPMDCVICGDLGMHLVSGKHATWYCNTCFPPFLSRDGQRLAGDPR